MYGYKIVEPPIIMPQYNQSIMVLWQPQKHMDRVAGIWLG